MNREKNMNRAWIGKWTGIALAVAPLVGGAWAAVGAPSLAVAYHSSACQPNNELVYVAGTFSGSSTGYGYGVGATEYSLSNMITARKVQWQLNVQITGNNGP